MRLNDWGYLRGHSTACQMDFLAAETPPIADQFVLSTLVAISLMLEGCKSRILSQSALILRLVCLLS